MNRECRQKLYEMTQRDGRSFRGSVSVAGNRIMYGNTEIANLHDKVFFYIQILNIRGNVLHIEGRHRLDFISDDYAIYARLNMSEYVLIEEYDFSRWDLYDEEHRELLIRGRGFRHDVCLTGVQRIEFFLKIGEEYIKLAPFFGEYGKFRNGTLGNFYSHRPYILKYASGTISVHPYRNRSLLKLEFRYILKDLIRQKHLTEAVIRICVFVYRLFKRRPIWLISERGIAAGDNGEALYRYMLDNVSPEEIDFRYVMYRGCKSWKLLKPTGRLVAAESFRHMVLLLCADRYISTQTNRIVRYRNRARFTSVKNLYDGDYVFLSHGVNEKDISSLIHKQRLNISLITVASEMEYNNLVKPQYAFREDEIVVTGFARYDRLYDKPENRILFLPTWRTTLAGAIDPSVPQYQYGKELKNSEYFRFYNTLFNDPRLLDAMRRNGFKGDFYLHPTIIRNWRDFDSNDVIEVHDEIAIYRDAFARAKLMLTDYSSVAFDFAYLNKPVVYSQYDGGLYFTQNNFGRSEFDYHRDGFGPVCESYEETLNTLIDYVDKGCRLEDRYAQNRESFFSYNDHDNSRRVYEAIKNMN